MGIWENSTLKAAAVMAVIAIVAAACGSPDPGGVDTTDVTEAATPGSTQVTTTDDTSAVPEAGPEVEIATVSLPDGLRPWWESTHRSAPFGGDVFLLAASSDVGIGGPRPNLQILRLDSALKWTQIEVSIPATVTSADMFMTGSRLAVSYLDPEGEIVLLTSTDGTDFEEARLPVPERYVAADTWATTSLIGSVAGAADLGGEVFAIVNTGVVWQRPVKIAEEYAAEQEQDPEVAEAIRFANTIRGKPVGDDDMLFVFEKGGEVVAEVLASDAGIEAGYIAAYNNRGDDTFESQSWMIKGSTSRNLDTPPFGGQEGIRLDALYPIEGGVAAMVTDFNLEAEQAAAFRWDFRPMVTLDGIVWFAEALLGVPPNSAIGSLAWAVCAEAVLFVLLFFGEVGLGMVFSTDGSNWGVADQTLDIPLLAGEPLQVQVTGETTFHVYSSADRSYRQYSVEYGPSGDALIEPIFESGVPELGENQVAVPRFLEEQQACDDQLVFPPMGVLLDTLFPRLPTGD